MIGPRLAKRTKIVCTVGPVSSEVSMLQKMIRAGMDVARLNFSHGTHAQHKRLIHAVRVASKREGKLVPIIGDLQGPKIRLGELPESGVELKDGEEITFTTISSVYKAGVIPVTYKGLSKDVKKGERFLIDDGLLELIITKIFDGKVHARVVNGGTVTSHKGMNFPDSKLSISAFTKKDKEDETFIISQ